MNTLTPSRRIRCFIPALLACVLSPWVALAEAAAPTEGPRPWVFPHPLRTEAFFAAGSALPWASPTSTWVSADGKHVAFFVREPSSAEGFSRTLVIKDVDTDTVAFEQALFSEEESLRYGSALERLAKDRAHGILSARPQEQWIPLAHQDLSSHEREFFSDACFEKQLRPRRTAALESLKITYQEPRLQVWRRGKKLLDRRLAAWRLKQESCPQASPSWLSRVFSDAARGVLLLELGFCGSDRCPEPATAFHALRLPQETPRARPTPTQPSVHRETAQDLWQGLYVTGLPAISQDGTQVLLAERVETEPGAPNLQLSIRHPRTQEPLWRYPLLEVAEGSTASKAALSQRRALDQKILDRIRAANEQLRSVEWVSLEEKVFHPIAMEQCPVEAQTLTLKGGTLTFHQGQLTLRWHDQTEPIHLSLPPPDTSKNEACDTLRRTFVETAYSDSREKTLVLHLSSCIDDTCPRRRSGYHLFQLPAP